MTNLTKKKQIELIIKPLLYKANGYTMIDFEGTRSDYKVGMVFMNVTPSGNLRIKYPGGTLAGNIPTNFTNKIAQLKFRDNSAYFWIEDGTGSLILDLKRSLLKMKNG